MFPDHSPYLKEQPVDASHAADLVPVIRVVADELVDHFRRALGRTIGTFQWLLLLFLSGPQHSLPHDRSHEFGHVDLFLPYLVAFLSEQYTVVLAPKSKLKMADTRLLYRIEPHPTALSSSR